MSSETRVTAPADLGLFSDSYSPDDEVMAAARAKAAELGCRSVSPSTGAALSLLAASVRARAVVEIGTGVGISGLCLLRGMTADGVLTTIDHEPELHRCARAAFRSDGFSPGRMRLIMGSALDVLPRLTSGGYDLVFADGARLEYPGYFEQGVQLLRPGGVIVFHDVLAGGRVFDPSQRDPEALALRALTRAIREDERLTSALLPLGDGLLAAAAVESR